MSRARIAAFGVCLIVGACGSDGHIDLGSAASGGATGSAGVGGTGALGAAGATTCGSSAQCIGERAFCELSSGRCVKCLIPGHCKESGKTCDPVVFECEDGCTQDGECSSGGKPFCEPTRGVCIECRQDTHCSGDENRCLTTVGKCVQCRGDTDCSNAEKPFCPLSRNECSECLVDGHCPGGQKCDPTDYQCRG